MYHTSVISGIASTEQYLATAGYDNKVILWDYVKRTPIAIGHHDHLANQVVFSNDGKLLASSSSDYTVRIWSVPELQLLVSLLHTDDVEGMAFNSDGTLIATASRDRLVRVFSVQGNLLHEFSGHTNDVLSVRWLDTKTLVSCGDDSTLRYWSITSRCEVKSVNLGGMETDTVCISECGEILIGDDDGGLSLLNSNGDIVHQVIAHRAGIKQLVHDKSTVISLSYDRLFKVWRVGGGSIELISEGAIPPIVWPRSCVFFGKNKIAFVTFGDRYAVYDLDTDKWQVDDIEFTHGVNSVHCDGNNVLTVGDSGVIKINQQVVNQVQSLCNFANKIGDIYICGGQSGAVYNALTGHVIYQHHSPINCCESFELEGVNYSAIGAYTGEVIFIRYNKTTGEAVFDVSRKIHQNAIKGICVRNNRIFTACADHSIKESLVCDNLMIETIRTGYHDKIVNGCSHLQGAFVSVGRDLKLNIWGKEEKALTSPHRHSIKCVASDGDLLIVTGGYRGDISAYHMNKNKWYSKKISISGISSVTYDALNSCFLASDYRGVVHSFNAEEIYSW